MIPSHAHAAPLDFDDFCLAWMAAAELERCEVSAQNSAPEAPHDNEADGLKRCNDCNETGWVTLFTGREHCSTCDGSGWT